MDQNTQSVPQTPPLPVQSAPAPPPKRNSSILIGILLLVIGILVGIGVSQTTAFSNIQIPYLTATPTPTLLPSPTPDPTADWKIFSDTKNGIQFKYPPNWYARQTKYATFSVYLNDEDFEIPDPGSLITPISMGFLEVTNTLTDVKSYTPTTIEEAVENTKSIVFGENGPETKHKVVGGKRALQISGQIGPGMLEGSFFKSTYIQMEGKVLSIGLNGYAISEYKNLEPIYDQILSTFRFL